MLLTCQAILCMCNQDFFLFSKLGFIWFIYYSSGKNSVKIKKVSIEGMLQSERKGESGHLITFFYFFLGFNGARTIKTRGKANGASFFLFFSNQRGLGNLAPTAHEKKSTTYKREECGYWILGRWIRMEYPTTFGLSLRSRRRAWPVLTSLYKNVFSSGPIWKIYRGLWLVRIIGRMRAIEFPRSKLKTPKMPCVLIEKSYVI